MHFTNYLYIVIIVFIFYVHAELRGVLQFFRHGARTPIRFYKNDPYKDPCYWEGLDAGQLTNEGKFQQFTLGQYTRQRYSAYLPLRYDKAWFYAQTTDVDRTHMSAQCNLYGLFPAQGDQVWLEGINWQPIPLHPADNKVLTTGLLVPACPAYETLVRNIMNSHEYRTLDQQYYSVYKYLTEHTGQNITDLISALYVYDALFVEEGVGYSLPYWTQCVYPEPLKTMANTVFGLVTQTTELKRLATGTLLNEIVEYFEGMSHNSTFSQKFRIYSCHDTNIAGLLNSFGAFDPPYFPAFASTIYIELHIYNNEEFVEVFSINGDEIKQISVNGCSLCCPLREFKQRLRHIILDKSTRDYECKIKD